MRVLIVHNRYQQKGGEDTVVAAETALLRSHGHPVELLQCDNDHIQGALSQIQAATRSVYSFAGKQRVRNAIRSFRPDVVHVHNYFPSLSAAVFGVCSEEGVPVVHTLHNFRIQCASSNLFRDGHICEDCVTSRSFLPGIQHACYRSSRLGSAVTGFGMAWHTQFGTWTKHISAFIALTEFSARKLGAYRIPPEKIFIKPNFVMDRGVGEGDGDYALFVGRLTPEKGIQTLIEADQAGLLCLDVIVLGDGQLRPALEQAAARPGSRLKLHGFAQPEQILTWMKGARVLLLPSLWYEGGLPTVVIEALAVGLPIIATNIGSTAAMLKATGAGLIYEPANAQGLASALRHFGPSQNTGIAMRQAARAFYESDLSPGPNYQQLRAIYHHVCTPAAR